MRILGTGTTRTPRSRATTWSLIGATLLVAGVAALGVPGTTSGFLAKVTTSKNSTATAAYFKCGDAEAADKSAAVFQYSLNEASSSTTAADGSGSGNAGTYQGAMTTSTAKPIACSRDSGGAYVLNGTSSYVSTPLKVTNPTTFSEEAWFKTSTAGGKILGFGASQTGSSSQYDRQVYVATTGQLVFGTYNGGVQIVTTPKTYTDGAWHHVVATMSPSTGMRLSLDGTLVASNATYTTPENTTGWWRVGYDNTSRWPNNGNNFFTGSLRYAAVYSTVLTAQQITNHFAAGQ